MQKHSNLDYDFNYNGKINFEKKTIHDKYEAQIEKINNAVFLDGTMSLEPRLQEYLKKKIFYKREGFEPHIKLSKTYQITPQDRIAMKNFLNGKTNIYTKGNYNTQQQNKIPEKKFTFLADQLKHDKRVPKIDYMPNKYKNIKEIKTMGMFGEEVPCNEISDIIDARDFIIRDEKDEKYRMQTQSNINNLRYSQDNLYQDNSQDRFKIASQMFNRSSRL